MKKIITTSSLLVFAFGILTSGVPRALAVPLPAAPIVTVVPVAGSFLHGTETFTINVSENNQLFSSGGNANIWVYLYNSAGAQKSQGASVNLSSGTGTFTVDTTKLDDGNTWLDVGQVQGADGSTTNGDTYFKNYTIDNTPPAVTVVPVAGSLLHGTETFTINVTDNNPLDPSKNKNIWVYLYNSAGAQKSQGASVNLSSGTGTFTVDTTKLDDGNTWLDVGQVFDAAGNPSGGGDNYFKDYVVDNTPPVVTVAPTAGSVLSGTETFTINVTDNNPLDPSKNKNIWVYLYNSAGAQKSQGASVNLSSGTGTFTVDTTKLDDGNTWLDVGQVFDAAGNPSGPVDNYFKDYDIENVVPDTVPPSVPVLLAPANSSTIPTNDFYFTWNPSTDNQPGPITYQFQSSLNPAETGNVLTNDLWTSGTLTSSTIHSTGAPDGTWYWQVRAKDAAGNTSAWSDIWAVTLNTDPPSQSSVYVHVVKYLDGAPETSVSASSTAFPMISTWTAANLNGGVQASGNYDLGADDSYQAVTSPMNSGASYTTHEDTSGAAVGADCNAGNPFALAGYSTGTSLAVAASSTVSTTTPNFVNLTGDEYVVVWNKNCLSAPTLLSPASGTVTSTAGLTSVSWSPVSDPAGGITYIYQSANSSSTNPDGSFASPAYTSSPLTGTVIPTSGTPAGVYYWHVEATDADGNVSPWSAMWTFTVDNTPPPVVYVTTNAATNVTSTSATLNGKNGPSAADNTSFWWGTTPAGPFTAGGNTTEFPVGWNHDNGLGSASAGNPFSEPLTNLTPSTTYYYAAWSEVGGVWYPGAVVSFTTAPATYVTTEAVTDVTSVDATLNGANGSFAADNTSFWWGTTPAGPFTAGGNTTEFPVGWNHDNGLGSASAGNPFSEPLTNLTPSTTYYYAAWSEVGGVWYPGAVVNFTTPSLDSDATLKALGVSAGVLNPVFGSGVTSYTDILSYYTTIPPTVTATTTVANATDTITQAVSNTGQAVVNVTAHDGTTKKQYTVSFSATATSTSLLKISVVVSGGSATSSDFTVNLLAAGASTSTFPGDPLGTQVTINGGASYNVNVSSLANYTPETNGVCNGVSTAGYEVDCVVTETHSASPQFLGSSLSGGRVVNSITVTQGANGVISPGTVTNVVNGTDRTFTITPNSGYQVSTVTVNGVSVGAVTTYTFTDVNSDETITASFSLIPVTNSGSNSNSSTSTDQGTTSGGSTGSGGGQVLGASTFNFNSDLSFGAQGPDVTELQKLLAKLGFYHGPINGTFGPLTWAAVKAFQLEYGLPATGFVGPLTRAKLNSLENGEVLGVSTSTSASQAQLLAILQQLLLLLQAEAH